jgi:hypothetical protein
MPPTQYDIAGWGSEYGLEKKGKEAVVAYLLSRHLSGRTVESREIPRDIRLPTEVWTG